MYGRKHPRELRDVAVRQAILRIHDKYLVNLQHIKAYHKGRGGSVEMSNKKELDVSTRKRDAFLAKLSEYTRGV
ncbi:MAG: LytTR family transcriptional regulator [Bacteroidetes bacterium]|nr:LytTR family transcriptional regulator [Bacteroidota bacterium]